MSRDNQFRSQKKTSASTLQGHEYTDVSDNIESLQTQIDNINATIAALVLGDTLTVQTETSGSFDITTTADQRVLVWLKGSVQFPKATTCYVEMTYDGVRVDSVDVYTDTTSDSEIPFALQWSSELGPFTKTLAVNTDGTRVQNLQWIVVYIN